jgi:hypothetical protein
VLPVFGRVRGRLERGEQATGAGSYDQNIDLLIPRLAHSSFTLNDP